MADTEFKDVFSKAYRLIESDQKKLIKHLMAEWHTEAMHEDREYRYDSTVKSFEEVITMARRSIQSLQALKESIPTPESEDADAS